MHLPSHSHGSSHLAILLEGSYLERTGSSAYLCLPGDAIHYDADVQHDNLFGGRLGRCLNFEFPEGETPQECEITRSFVPAEVRSLIATNGQSLELTKNPWLRTARQLIDRAPAISLAPLAERLAVHPSHLAKSFRRAYGLSVGQYSKLKRIRAGAKLLIESDAPVAEIAYEAGFFDQSHFSNAFLQMTGFTPASLRRIAHA
jgi:AraC family transcriptional regulator